VDNRSPGGKNIIPAEKPAKEEIALLLHPLLKRGDIAKEGGGAFELTKGLGPEVESVALRAGDEIRRNHGTTLV
jgi:hypothetical protein